MVPVCSGRSVACRLRRGYCCRGLRHVVGRGKRAGAGRRALAKATINRKTGVLVIPTRLVFRDEYLYATGSEGRAEASLRLRQFAGIVAGMGLLAADDARWLPGPRADLLQ